MEEGGEEEEAPFAYKFPSLSPLSFFPFSKFFYAQCFLVVQWTFTISALVSFAIFSD